MKAHFSTALIAVMLATALGVATNSPGKSPPPPPYNPQITYAVGSGSSTTFMVANADGTDAVSLYSTRSLTSGLKFAPTGNRIVFTEGNDIKVLTYAVSSHGVTTTNVSTLSAEPYQPLHVDVSPDGTEVLVVEKNGIVNQYAVCVVSLIDGTRTPILLTPDLYFDAVWANSNSRIAVIQGGPVQAGYGSQTIQVIDLDVANNYAVLDTNIKFTNTASQLYEVRRIESAHTSDTLLFSATSGTNTNVYTLDIGTSAVSAPIVAGSNASFNAGDSAILFVGPTAAYFYEFNLETGVETLINSSKGLAQPDFLP